MPSAHGSASHCLAAVNVMWAWYRGLSLVPVWTLRSGPAWRVRRGALAAVCVPAPCPDPEAGPRRLSEGLALFDFPPCLPSLFSPHAFSEASGAC